MTTAGWIFLIVSWLVILGLFVYSLARTLSRKGSAPDGDQSPLE